MRPSSTKTSIPARPEYSMVRSQPACPEQTLIDAARHCASRVSGRKVSRIVLTLDDGTKWKIDLPKACDDRWPPAEGWGCKGDRGSLDGIVFRLNGKPLAIFKAIVEAGDAGIGAQQLKLAIWDTMTEDKIMENSLTTLRGLLREALDLDTDANPIQLIEGNYCLIAP